MITLGIDMSSQPERTAVARIDWRESSAEAYRVKTNCSDSDLYKLIEQPDVVVGIDAPFGWPLPFLQAVARWTYVEWTSSIRDQMRFRETDRCVCQSTLRDNGKPAIYPLSVSTDKIAMPAMRTMALLHRYGVTDRSGDGRFYEVYPGASLYCWGLPHNAYKGTKNKEARQRILNEIKSRLPQLENSDDYVTTDHCLDALVASLTARAAYCTFTKSPSSEQSDLARQEGWVHLPLQDSLQRLI